MSKNRTVPKICAQILIASLALTAAASAQACHRWYQKAGCAAQAAANRARDAAEATKRAAEAAAAAARAEAERAAAAAAAAAAEADRLAKEEAARIAAEAAKLAADGAAISSDEMRNLRAQANSAYSASTGAVISGYNGAVAELKKFYDAALEALFREAGRLFLASNRAVVGKLASNLNNLDAEGKAALNSVVRAIPTRQITDDTRKAMYTLGSKLGLIAGQANSLSFLSPPDSRSPLRVFAESFLGLIAGQAISQTPSNVRRSSFGIYIGGGAAAGVGAEVSYALVMQSFLEDGQFRVGFTQSVGTSYGVQEGAGAEIGLFWGPGGIDDAAGPSVGFGVGAGAMGIGAAGGLSWSVPTSAMNFSSAQKIAEGAIPGVSIAYMAAPEKVEGAFQVGHTSLIVKF